ncbi:MAG: hypothetical protein FJ306_08545 [Planctomycetes bacterium]|nr:hypothetical protein [Planctomycetota bacterium]
MLRTSLSVAFLLASQAVGQCTLTAPGSQILPYFVDSWTAIQSIGFSFPFCGNNYTDCYITDHGMIALTNGGTPAVPPGGSFIWDPMTSNLVTNAPLICPYWSDHTPGTAGQLWIDNTSGTRCTITWLDHQTFGQPPQFTMQVTLYPNGNIVFCLDSRVDNNGSSYGSPKSLTAVMAVSPGQPAALPAQFDFSVNGAIADNCCHQSWQTAAPGVSNPLFDVENSTITLVPTNPGWVVIFDTLACASQSVYGTGCDGLSLLSNNPVLGTNWTLTTSGIGPLGLAFTFIGTGPLGLPLPVLGINSPGCTAEVSGILANVSGPVVAGVMTATIPVPLNASFKNVDFYSQTLQLTLSFPSGLSTSNGAYSSLGF